MMIDAVLTGVNPISDTLRTRPAQAGDATVCAPLVFASGVREFSFFLGQPEEVCIAFLRFAFASGAGRFSWRRHRVALDVCGDVVAVLALHDGRHLLLDDPHVAFMLWRFFGLRRTISMLLRGLVLESELPAPKRTQTLVAHCATRADVRSTGAFSVLFGNALQSATEAVAVDREIVLDVLLSNVRARDLYRRLGFVEVPRARARSPRLPAALASVRMRLVRGAGRQ
jgi:hypothetical protein